MMDETLEFRAYMRAAGANFDPPAGECPGELELAEYGRGALPAERAEQIQGHLMACGNCRKTAVDLADFLEPAPFPGKLDKEWREFRRRIAPEKPGGFDFLRLRWQPAAAALAFAALFSSGTFVLTRKHYLARESALVAEVRRSEGAQNTPRLNATLADLLPGDTITRSASGRVNTVSLTGRPLILILNAAGHPDAGECSVVIVDRGGREVWRGSGLARLEGNYVITLPPGFLEAGEYTFRLWTEGGGTIAEYPLKVTR